MYFDITAMVNERCPRPPRARESGDIGLPVFTGTADGVTVVRVEKGDAIYMLCGLPAAAGSSGDDTAPLAHIGVGDVEKEVVEQEKEVVEPK